jgi:hypothetical protein
VSTIASGLILGFLLATAYGAGFHFIIGGRPRKLLLYLSAAWLGFLIGHFIGDLLGTDILSLGAVNLISASIGSWLALISSWFLSEREA